MSASRSRVALAAIVAASVLAAGGARAEIAEYVVQPGDTCESISLRFWGNQLAYDKLHVLNPKMGPMPHTLVAGTVLMVDKPGPDARVTAIHNKVESATPGVHGAFRNEPLSRGNTVSTEVSSHAEVTFRDSTRVQLGEQTLVVILGDASSKSAVRSSAGDTTLVSGSLRAHLGDFAGKRAPLATPSARLDLGKGLVKVSVDEEKTTRLAVHAGTSSITSGGKSVAVNDGFGSKARLGATPTPPRPLPDAPSWTTSPPRTLLALDTAVLTATYGPAADGKGPASARWHVELARDEKFNEYVVDATVPAEIVKLEAKQLPQGTYYTRVSGIDADRFEGKFGPVSATHVLTAKLVPARAGKRAEIEPPVGSFCSLDGAPFVAAQAPLALTPAHAHVLRCSDEPDGAAAAQLDLGEELAGPVTITATPATAISPEGARLVTVTLRDAAGALVPGAKITATASDGATVEPASETSPPGTYVARVHVPAGVRSARVSLSVRGSDAVAIDVAGAAPHAPPPNADPLVEAPRPRWEVAAGLEATTPATRSALGWGGTLQVARTIPEKWLLLSIGLRGAFSLRGAVAGDAIPCGSPSAAAPCAPGAVFDTRVSRDTVTLGVSLELRARATSWLTPYVLFRPGVLYDRATTRATSRDGTPERSSNDGVTRFTMPVGVGASFRVGPGGIYVEAAYGTGGWHFLDAGRVRLAGGLLDLGYRLEL